MEGASAARTWYCRDMKEHRTSTGPSEDSITTIATRMRLNLKLLEEMAEWSDKNERIQRRFRNAVLFRLAKIETTVSMIHAAQIVEAHESKPNNQERIKRHGENAGEYVAKHSKALGLKMVRYIHDESGEQEVPHDRRRKWSGWEI